MNAEQNAIVAAHTGNTCSPPGARSCHCAEEIAAAGKSSTPEPIRVVPLTEAQHYAIRNAGTALLHTLRGAVAAGASDSYLANLAREASATLDEIDPEGGTNIRLWVRTSLRTVGEAICRCDAPSECPGQHSSDNPFV